MVSLYGLEGLGFRTGSLLVASRLNCLGFMGLGFLVWVLRFRV